MKTTLIAIKFGNQELKLLTNHFLFMILMTAENEYIFLATLFVVIL